MRRLVVTLILLVPLALLALPAKACSCAAMSVEQMRESHEVAFIGTIIGSRPTTDQWAHSLVFEVETVFAGDLAAETEVVAPIDTGGGCGIAAAFGTRLAIFATLDGGRLWSSSCSLQEPGEVIAALGPGTPPAPAAEEGFFDWQAVWLGVGAAAVVGAVWLVGHRGAAARS